MQFTNTDEFLSLLGSIPDTAIAVKYGISRSTVLKARHTKGIPACSDPKRKRMPIPPGIVPLLGQVSDHKLASKFRVSYYYVNQLRRSLGITAFQQFQNTK